MKISFIILFVFLAQICLAQLGYIPLNVDYATFRGAGDKTYTEIYLSFYQQDLQYTEQDSLFHAQFSHTLIISQEDSIFYQTTRNYKSTAQNNQVNVSNLFMDVFAMDLDPGNYTVKANVIDKTSNISGEYNLNMEIPEFSDSLSLSSIEIATKIDPNGNDSNFSLKNNVTIYPNASKTYTIINPIMYFYFEGYGLQLDASNNSQFSYEYYISDMDGKRLRDYPAKNKTATTETIAEATGVNVIALPTGSYFLSVRLNDLVANQSTHTRKKFYINKPERKKSSEMIAAKIEGYEEYALLKREQLIDEFNKIKYIASTDEIDIFEKLENTEAMKRFLSQFWKRRDTDTSTPINEYKQLYIENLQLANANFSSNFKEGWQTDRGRVILIYGRPDEIERNPSSLDTRPHEIWHYYSLEGGTQFIFADISGNGNYELLHSTYRNEIKDPEWRSRIEQMGNRSFNAGDNTF